MASESSVGIITGGSSGIGLATVESLVAQKNWTLYIFDKDATKGQAEAERLGVKFVEVDVTNYSALATAFNDVFKAHQKINFVFANAGVALSGNFYESQDSGDQPPTAPDTLIIDVNLKAAISTSHLAQHYFRKSPAGSPRDLIVTASSASLYASPMAPTYCASKHGVIGFTRSIAPQSWRQDKIRVNAICPGIVKTNILPAEVYAMFPEPVLTPVSKVVEVVHLLLDQKEEKPLIGQAVEICGTNHYFRKQVDYCDATMAAVMGSTDIDQ